MTLNASNRDKHINETTKQIFANNHLKISCKCAQGMQSNWKISFNVINIRTYDKEMCNLSKITEIVL